MTGNRMRIAISALLAGVLGAAFAAAARPGVVDTRSPAQRVATVEASVSASVVRLRERHGLTPLRQHAGLARAASAHSTAMVKHGFFSHLSVDGASPASRIAGYYPRGPRGRVWRVGEVIYRGPVSANGRQAIATWLSSPAHRALLLDPRFRNIGVSAIFSRSAPGAFGGRPVLVVTVVLGAR